jgi:hypothetical protein
VDDVRRHSDVRAVIVASCASLAIVVAVATLLPRSFLTTDDAGLSEYLRKGVFTSWMSQIFVWAQIGMYRLAPDVPWFGLYLYALIVATGTVLIHTCVELVDTRPGYGQVATRLGALVLAASHAVLAVGVTWTTVSIAASCAAATAFVAHLHICEATGRRASRLRALAYGLLLVAGYTLRTEALGAMVAAIVPLLGWVALQWMRRRYLPRIGAVIVFCAPLAIVMAIQDRIPQPRGAEFDVFNDLRGRIHGHSAFANLDTRAPEILERAGWTAEEYRDFGNWLYLDDTQFSVAKLQRLVDTGGAPQAITASTAFDAVHGIVDDSPVSVWLFLSVVAGGLVLAWLRVIDRRRAVMFSVGYLVLAIAIPVWMSSQRRFPQRVSLEFYIMMAFALFVILAREVAAQPAGPQSAPTPDRRARIGLLAMSLLLFCWAKNLIAWLDRPPWRYHVEIRQLAERIAARNGFVIVGAGVTELDPLLADPYAYDGLPAGWGTFSAPWYDYLARFGLRNGNGLVRWLVDNPNAYVLTDPYGRPVFQDWVRRTLHDPSIRLAIVDAADMPTPIRSELYRVVSTPLLRGSDEWKLLARIQWRASAELPGPPGVHETFREIPLLPRYATYGSHLSPIIEPVDGGLRVTSRSEARRHGCEAVGATDEPHRVGVRIPVDGLRAARFDIELIQPEHIVDVSAWAETKMGRSIRWRWELGPEARQFGFAGTVMLVPGYPARRFELARETARPEEVVDLHVFITVDDGAAAAFELRHVEIAEP